MKKHGRTIQTKKSLLRQAAQISLNSLLPVMTADNKERNQLSFVKSVAYTLGAMAVTLVGSVVGALGVKERVAFEGTEEEKYGFRELIGFLFSKPVFVTFVAALLCVVGGQVAMGANAYYFTYIMGDLSLMAGVSGISMFGMVPGMIIAPLLANAIGKKKMYAAGIIVCVLILPAAFCLIGGLVFGFGYKLGKKEVDEIAAAIAEKKADRPLPHS